MVKIQIDLPEEIDHKLSVYSVEKRINDKRLAIIEILKDRFSFEVENEIN